MRSTGLKLTLCGVLVCAAVASGVIAAPDVFDGRTPTLSTDEERGSTIPFDERELAFNTPGLISDVSVKDGDLIKTGQVLALQDTEVEQAALAREQFLLNSNVQLRAATAQRELAEVKLQRKEKLRAQGAGSVEEHEEAKLELTVAKLKEELANEETESKRLDIVKLTKQIERMRIISPFDGQVRKVEAAVGEVSDPQKPSIVVVSNDPLKVEVKLPTLLTTNMKLGQVMQVRYIEEQKWRDAEITYFDPVADATTGTQLVHLKLPNPEGRRAGQEMAVKLPQQKNVAAAK